MACTKLLGAHVCDVVRGCLFVRGKGGEHRQCSNQASLSGSAICGDAAAAPCMLTHAVLCCTALQYAEKQYGGLRGYMERIGFDRQEQERLCRSLTSPAPWK